MVTSDIKYLWAAYKMGGMNIEQGMSIEEFKAHMFSLLTDIPMLWLLGENPVAMVHGTYAQNSIWVGWVTFPWASSRKLYENAVNFVNVMRKDVNMLFMTHDSRLMDAMAKHGIIRRAGTFYDIYEKSSSSDGRACIYQSRMK